MPSPTLKRPHIPGEGLLKGLGVTLKNMVTPAVTRQYPHEKPDLAPRTRGVIALMEENCTVCMLCAKECPDWCIYIESHKERVPAAQEGGRERTRNQLDRFAIDFALCMYCGICVEVCPFDALFWSPEFEYSTYTIGELTHEKDKLREWMDTVPPPPQLEDGAVAPMEVDRALEQAEQTRQAALEQARKEAAQRAGPQQQAAAGTGAPTKEREEADIEVEAQVDQETYDRLIEEGKSERVARARAKAAYVRREKARIRAEREAAAEEPSPAEASTSDAVQQDAPPEVVEDEPPAATGPAARTAEAEPEELDIEPGEIDQETFDRLVGEGKSERVARARAKAAAIRKARARARQDGEGGDGGAE